MLELFLAGLTDSQLDQMFWSEMDTLIDSDEGTSPLMDAICHEQFLRWAEEEG